MKANLQIMRPRARGRGASVAQLAALLLIAGLITAANCTPVLKARLIVSSGLTAPIYVTAPNGDPRLFIVERAGVVKILQNGSVLPTPFLNISSQVGQSGEGGLLSIAFPPNYASSGEFYAFYSSTTNVSTLSRFLRSSTNPDLADVASQHVLLTIPLTATNHKGGTIRFSPIDGYLYVGLGDGGSSSQTARDPASLLGKMLRLNVAGGPTSAYTIPPTNPFVGNDGVLDEIWAFGFRNPFRWSFDRVTGDMWIGDVGANAIEEVDFEPVGEGGRDYGWPTHEGSNCLLPTPSAPCDDPENPVRYTFPVTEYNHDDGSCAITGGVLSRGSAAFLAGSYTYADFCSGKFWGLINGQVVQLNGQLGAGTLGGISSISEDGSGQIYFTQLTVGRLYKIE